MRKSVLLTLALLSLMVGANAWPAAANTNQQEVPNQARDEGNQTNTFTGTVWLNGGKFVLRDAPHKTWYQLDDQRSAARFEGKEVRVTGTLDIANNAIHVLDIREDPVHRGSSAIPVTPMVAGSFHQQMGGRLTT